MINSSRRFLCRTSAALGEYRSSNFGRPYGTGPEPVQMSYTLHETVADAGHKPPIIIMHGLFGCKNNWNGLSVSLHSMTQRKIITVDARNHGDSPHTVDQSYPIMAEDVKFLMKSMNLEKASFIGHSMGGRTMMYLAVTYPELVESLIAVDISPINSKEVSDIQSIVNTLKSVNLDINAPISKVRKSADEQMKCSIDEPAIRQFLITNIIQVGNKYKWRINLDSIDANFHHISKFPSVQSTFEGPTYFIGGGNSAFLKRSQHEAIKEIFPAAKFDYIPGAGHWLHYEKPVEFLKLVTQFLGSV